MTKTLCKFHGPDCCFLEGRDWLIFFNAYWCNLNICMLLQNAEWVQIGVMKPFHYGDEQCWINRNNGAQRFIEPAVEVSWHQVLLCLQHRWPARRWLLQKRDNSNSIYMKAGQSASIQLPDVFFSAKPSQLDILHRICSGKNYYCVVYKIKAPVFSRSHNLKKQGSNALFALVFMYPKFPSWRSTSFGQIQAKHQVLLISGRKGKRAKINFQNVSQIQNCPIFLNWKFEWEKLWKLWKSPRSVTTNDYRVT